MKEYKVTDQVRIIRDPNNLEATMPAEMPIVLALDDGTVAETISMRGAVALIGGLEYFDCQDPLDEWVMRCNIARREAMKALQRGLYVEVYDSKKGVINNNYAVEPDDPDYEVESEEGQSLKLYIDNDKALILSLISIDAFVVLEREDSFQLREHEEQVKIKNRKSIRSCSRCIHNTNETNNGRSECKVYDEVVIPEEENNCSSFTFDSLIKELIDYSGQYIDIGVAYDINSLMEKLNI